MSTALIVRDDSKLSIAFTDSALALKQSALERAALIGKVDSALTQEDAVRAQKELANVLTLVEKARKEAKEPILDAGRALDATAAAFVQEAKDEQFRISLLVANFQQLEQARIRAAQQAENERLAALEREKAKEIMQAKSHDDVDKIQARYNERAAVEAPKEPIAPIRANGQRVREDWDIQVTDIWALVRAHPVCCSIEPRLSEIRNLLDAGVKVAGVTAKRVVKAGVTSGKMRPTIDV